MKFARDVMTLKPVCIYAEDRLEEALELFLRHRYRSLPVLDSDNKPMGTLTEISLVKALAIQKHDPGKQTVKEFSSTFAEAIYVKEGTEVKDFLSEVVQKGHARVLVLGMGDKLIGIISPRDILKLFSGKLLQQVEDELQREVDRAGATQKVVEDFVKKVDPNSMYLNAFDYHPFMHILFSTKGILLSLNKAFKDTFNFDLGDMEDLQLKHLMTEESHIRLSQEITRGRGEPLIKNIELVFIKNGKNLIPCNCELYTFQESKQYIHLLKILIKED
tara:strand:- start:6577 stop:7401 length:825 start_codon:yes stop_codon:yes gene_type:complete